MTAGSTWGRIICVPDSGLPSLFEWLDHDPGGFSELLIWLPPDDLASELMEGFHLPLRCYRGTDGVRRFSPVGVTNQKDRRKEPVASFDGFLALAWLGGFAVLCREFDLCKEQRFSYRLMWFLFQRLRKMQEHIMREFRWSRDLSLQHGNREFSEDSNILRSIVLPGDYLNNKGRQSIRILRRKGKQAAQDAGILEPTDYECLQFGIWSAAKEWPLQLHDSEATTLLIRQALFDVEGESHPEDTELREILVERFSVAFENHLDDSTDAFNMWFFSSSVIKQLAKKKKARGGALEGKLVRDGLIRLGWDAYTYVAGCLNVQMQAFANALPEPLTDRESQIFKEMHRWQPHWGNLCLLQLWERVSFAGPAFRHAIENHGDRDAISACKRMLQYYSALARARRGADRKEKTTKKQGQPLEFNENRDSERSVSAFDPGDKVPKPGRISDSRDDVRGAKAFAARVFEDLRVRCKCQTQEEANLHVLPETNSTYGGTISILLTCETCGFESEKRVDFQHLKALGQAVFGTDRAD